MKASKQRLMLEQTERKLKPFLAVGHLKPPPKGWIHTVRTSLNISLRHLSNRLGMTIPSVRESELREQNGTISLQSLKDIAQAMDMHLVYALVPNETTLSDMIDKKAEEKARQIVDRTNITMDLEKQGLQQDRLLAIVLEKKDELKNEMPKLLWD